MAAAAKQQQDPDVVQQPNSNDPGSAPARYDKPEYCWTSGCPMREKGRGFALGCGDPNAPIAILFERPAEDELAYVLDVNTKPERMSLEKWREVQAWRKAEIERRRKAYPELGERFILRGAPVRGASGAELETWAFPMVGGLKLDECYLENTLHCAAPNEKQMYPTGLEREVSEACCAHWNRLIPKELYEISSENLRVVREKVSGSTLLPKQQHLAQQVAETEVLQQKVFHSVKSGTEIRPLERRKLLNSSRLSPDLHRKEGTAEAKAAQTIPPRASIDHGEKTRAEVKTLGTGPSSERHQERQPNGELRINDEEPTHGKGVLSILSRTLPHTVNTVVWSLHPAGLLKETGGGIVALPLQVDTFAKAKAFVKAGRKVLVLAGGKAAKFWTGYGEAVTKWCGHYVEESEGTWQRRLERIAAGLKTRITASKVKGSRKATAGPKKPKGPLKAPRPRGPRKTKAKIEGFEVLGV